MEGNGSYSGTYPGSSKASVSIKSSKVGSTSAVSRRYRRFPSTYANKSFDPLSMSSRLSLPPPQQHKDTLWITNEVMSIYKPRPMPKDINQLSHRIKYSDAIELRKICHFIRANQWADISQKKMEFRNGAWQRMRIDHIPPGKLKEHFITAFTTYLPSQRLACLD